MLCVFLSGKLLIIAYLFDSHNFEHHHPNRDQNEIVRRYEPVFKILLYGRITSLKHEHPHCMPTYGQGIEHRA